MRIFDKMLQAILEEITSAERPAELMNSQDASRVDELARRKKRIAAHGPDMPVAVIIPTSFAGNNRHAQHVVKLRKHNLEKELSHQEARWHPTNISSINAT
jgi:hypothetical protein